MDWEQEFRYLETRSTRPSADDLYNSLRNRMDKEHAAALACLIKIAFDRIAEVEAQVVMKPSA